MENCCRPSLPFHLISLLLLIQLPSWASTEEFLVLGPSDPLVAVLDGDVTLPCSVSPITNVENMELRWFRTKFSEAVFIYQNQREQNEEQMAEYAGRTSLVRDFLTQGKAAVKIHKVRVSDNGTYTCFFKKGAFYEEAKLEVKVAGMGSAPEVHIQGPEEDGVRVVCTASGWFPKPQVQWRGLSGRKFLTFSEAYRQDVKELFSVEATLVVRDSSVGNVTCSILNPILGQEKAMAIFIPEPFFPQASPEKPAFIVSLTLLGLLLFGAGYFLKREHSTKVRVHQEQVDLQRAKEEDQQTKEKEQKAIVLTMVCSFSAWKKAQLYADWRKEMFQAWSVILDPDSAYSDRAISPEKTRLTWKDNYRNPYGLFSVLGLEGITSGLCHWEVVIENVNSSLWTLGVCREDAERQGWYRECPEKGFWLVGRFADGYCACMESRTPLSLRQDPCRVGVFLDYSEGDVSFYNMTDGSHIFSFSGVSFCGTLFPYFSFRSGDVSVTICSMVSGSERLPVPVDNSPSLEETLSPSEEGFSSGSGVAVDPSGVESPLLPCHPEAVSS
uniref:Butyrophilin subfamily 1 member A1-like n=1 Tax=Castor canadensis TaxID=51338 RepID=A0A8B7TTI6_CASCN|nr:butyrophilin subfamily 1 member A1-like [Castor canadensis]